MRSLSARRLVESFASDCGWITDKPSLAGWGTLAHDAVMAIQASQLKQLRSELLPLTVVAFLCVALIALSPPKQVVQSFRNQ